MKELFNAIISIIIIFSAVTAMQMIKDKELTLQKVKYEKALKVMVKKYEWKSDRLRIYTDLVYNTKNGAIYEK